MQYRKILTIFILAVALCSYTSAQEKDTSVNLTMKKYLVVRTTPVFTLGLTFNYNQSALELSGTYNDDYRSLYVVKGETFGADKGFGANLTGKLALGDKGNWRVLMSASYNRIESYLFGGKASLADQGKSTFNAFTFGLGLEDNFTPHHNFKIYAAFDILASMISGNSHIWIKPFDPVYNPNSPTPLEWDVTYKNSFRVGYGIGGGTEYMLNDNIGLNLGIKFSHLNLFGKQEADSNSSGEIVLPDASSTKSGYYRGDKNFAFFTIQAGIVFYWGINQKRYKMGF